MTDWWQSSPLAEPEAQKQFATGDAYLKTLSPEMAGIVKGLAEYKVSPTTLSIKGGHRENMIGSARRFDPDYDQAAYPARAAAIKEFTAGGPSSPAGQITAGRKAILHAGEMADAAEELKAIPGFWQKLEGSGLPFISYAGAMMKNAALRGTPEGKALTNFLTARNHFSEEVTKFYAGSSGSEAERSRTLANLDPALSLPELRSGFAQEGKLIADAVSALQGRFKTALGPKAWLTATEGAGPQFPILDQQAQDALKKISERAQPKTEAPPGNAASTPDAEGWFTMPGNVRIREKK